MTSQINCNNINNNLFHTSYYHRDSLNNYQDSLNYYQDSLNYYSSVIVLKKTLGDCFNTRL
jgi:hypothetical protein